MVSVPESATNRGSRTKSFPELSRYEKPDTKKAVWQLINSFVPYIGLWIAMVYLMNYGMSYWLILPLAILASGFLMRIFIFFHDCGHDCFFASRKANRFLGFITGVLTFTPFDDWRHQHALHHASAGDLDRRGAGDVWTLTVSEYESAPKLTRLGYRLFRHPFTLFVLGPIFLFFIAHRFPHKGASKRERMSVHTTNLALLAIMGLASVTIGLKTYLLIQLPVMGIAGVIGVWLFYVQHQYESVYWADHQNWDPIEAALAGSSYYKLPKVLQWFSGNIGFHHIHHLRSRIPNYHLAKCHQEVPAMQQAETLTLGRSLRSMFLNLWDDTNQKMVSFRALRRRHRLHAAE